MANRSVDGNICCELGVRSERKQDNNFPRRLIAIPSPAGLVPQPVLHAKQLLRHLELMCAVPWGCTGETARANLIVARIARPDQYHQMCGRTCKNGISSWEIHRALKVTQKTAWFMLHRVRVSMKDERDHKFGFGGPVESDETFVGPNPAKMHKIRKAKIQARDGAKGGYVGKTAVHGILDRELRQVRAKVLPNVKRETLQGAILDSV